MPRTSEFNVTRTTDHTSPKFKVALFFWFAKTLRVTPAVPPLLKRLFLEATDMEFLIALAVVFAGICAWIHYYGDETPPDDDDYFSRSNRYGYNDDDSDNDSDGDSGGDDD